MQLKEGITSAYGNSLLAGFDTGKDWEAAKMVETHESESDDVESEEGWTVPDMANYFISSEIPEE